VADTWEDLCALARDAATRAYCPYSGFAVGAAVQSGDGRVFAGANVENASYGLTVCAERVAIARAVSDGVRRIVRLAIHTPTEHPVPPCGACRQVLAEFGADALVRATCDGPEWREWSAAELLPEAFGLGDSGTG